MRITALVAALACAAADRTPGLDKKFTPATCKEKAPAVVLVAGASRSGTSALAHLLSLFGADTGQIPNADPRHPGLGSFERC